MVKSARLAISVGISLRLDKPRSLRVPKTYKEAHAEDYSIGMSNDLDIKVRELKCASPIQRQG